MTGDSFYFTTNGPSLLEALGSFDLCKFQDVLQFLDSLFVPIFLWKRGLSSQTVGAYQFSAVIQVYRGVSGRFVLGCFVSKR